MTFCLNCGYQSPIIGVKFDENRKLVMKIRAFWKFEWSAWKLIDCRICTKYPRAYEGLERPQTPYTPLQIPVYGPVSDKYITISNSVVALKLFKSNWFLQRDNNVSLYINRRCLYVSMADTTSIKNRMRLNHFELSLFTC